MRWLSLLIVAVIVAVAGPALAATQPAAEEAYARGDYATAFKIWLPLAEQGSAYAAQNIARMYERGEWVAQDGAMAGEWYRKAAAFQAYDASLAPPGQAVNGPDPNQAVAASGQSVASPVIIQQVVTRPVTRPIVYTVPVYYPPRPVYVVPRPSPPPSHHTHHHSGRR